MGLVLVDRLYQDIQHILNNILNYKFKELYSILIKPLLKPQYHTLEYIINDKIPVEYAGYLLAHELQTLGERFYSKCKLLSNSTFKNILDNYVEAFCYLKDDWIYKFGTGAGDNYPDPISFINIINIFRDAKLRYGDPLDSKNNINNEFLDYVFEEYQKAHSQGMLRNVGPVILSHWLSLAWRRVFVPLDKPRRFAEHSICRYFNVNCNKMFSSDKLYFDVYKEYIEVIHNIVYKKNIIKISGVSDEKSVEDFIEFYTLLRVYHVLPDIQ